MLHTTHKLFPRIICEGNISDALLSELRAEAEVVFEEDRDWAHSLAGELEQQVFWPLDKPGAAQLKEVLEASCYHWLEEAQKAWPVKSVWNYWDYSIDVTQLWLNKQVAGDYNPLHGHSQDFSGVLYLNVPDGMIPPDGHIVFTGPEGFSERNFMCGFGQDFLPVPGQYFVFPAWQPHSVNPFRCDGERVSVAFNARVTMAEGWNKSPGYEEPTKRKPSKAKGFG